jgi:D-glycero-D-manno-heptose 1,7-bisphosphate phosphatase
MMLDIGRRYNVDLAQVAMVGDTQRDLIAAQTAGCEAHLIRTGRAAHLTAAEVQRIVDQVPGAQVHADLGSFADFVLRRADSADAMPGGQD